MLRFAQRLTLVLFGLLMTLVASGPAGPSITNAQGLSEAYARVDTFDSADEPRESGLYKGPWGATFANDGRMLIADRTLGALHVLDPLGSPIELWGEDGSLGKPRDVAASSAFIYVSEPDEEKIYVLDQSGNIMARWGMGGGPSGLAVDPARGRLYVTRSESHDVVVLNAADGSLIEFWGADITGLSQPWGIDVDQRGYVYICDIAAGATQGVSVFQPDGTPDDFETVEVEGRISPPLDVAVDDDGDRYVVTELALFRLHDDGVGAMRRTPGGRGVAVGQGSDLLTTVQDFREGFTGLRYYRDRRRSTLTSMDWGGPYAPLGTIAGPWRLSANTDDRLFMLDTWPRVQAWDGAGTPLDQFGAGGLHDIAAGLRGSVFAIDGRSMEYRSQDGDLVWGWQPPGSDPRSGNPYSWLTSADSYDLPGFGNSVLVFDLGDQYLYVVDFSGNPVAEWAVSPPDGFVSLADAALAADSIYLLNRTTGRLETRRLGDGRLMDSWSVPGSATRVDVGPDGQIYVLNRESWVLKYAPDGTLISGFPVGEPDARGRLPEARDLATGPDGRVYVAISTDEAGEVGVFEPDPSGTPPTLPQFASRCLLDHDKTAAPFEVELGYSVEVNLSIDGECPLADGKSDIMLLVDTSGSMAGAKIAAARTAALEFVGQLDYSLNQVGLITFSTNVAMVQELTSNPRELLRAIPSLGDDGGTNMLEAMQLAADEFASPRKRPDAKQVIILLTDGYPSGGAGEILMMASSYRQAGNPEIYAIGLGLDVGRSFLREVATAPNFFFEAPTEYDLSKIYDVIARRVRASMLLERVTVTDQLPGNMRYVRNTASPAASFDAASNTLTWTLEKVTPAGMRLRYRVEPLEPGLHPTNVYAEADYIDGIGVSDRLVFPIPEVFITAPEVFKVFLPVLYKQKCPEIRTDAVLVIDTSGSMREAPSPGQSQTKLEAAIDAAKAFLVQLELPLDKVALVAFNGEATSVLPLTGDQGALVRALNSLPVGSGTRIDLGMEQAIDALGQPGRDRVPAIILLTDGNPSETTIEAVEASARRAADEGMVLFTIGLGSDANMDLLRRMAVDPSRAIYAPSEADLAQIYRDIASSLPCQPR